jgi:carboxyl-terminal processing protease
MKIFKNFKKCILACCVILAVFTIYKISSVVVIAGDEIFEQVKLLIEIAERIKEAYVEPVETKKLIHGAASGMVRTLDPFSQFLEPEDYKEMKVETEGEYGGLGIRISIKDDYITVITPLPGTPAYREGILPGDKIIKIEGENIKGITLEEAVKRLRGAPGTKVTITISREGVKEPFDVTLTREIIKIENLRYEMLENNIGYIWLIEFNAKISDDLKKALDTLKSKGMKSLILDLRNNPGGLLEQAVEVTKLFIGGNKLIVYTEGRRKEERREYYSASVAPYQDIPIVMLVNKGSASGSEIVAGAFKDHKRGLLIGSTTFGKGSVQSVFRLSDGSGLRLTVAKYYTPSGKCIHDVGITPDIEINLPIEVEVKLRMQKELTYAKDKAPESIVKKEEQVEDVVLKRAVEFLKAYDIWNQSKKM